MSIPELVSKVKNEELFEDSNAYELIGERVFDLARVVHGGKYHYAIKTMKGIIYRISFPKPEGDGPATVTMMPGCEKPIVSGSTISHTWAHTHKGQTKFWIHYLDNRGRVVMHAFTIDGAEVDQIKVTKTKPRTGF